MLGINRTQALVLGFCLVAWFGLITIVATAPHVFTGTFQLLPGGGFGSELMVLLAITAVIGLLGVGVVRRWRWLFWLILVAFLAGALRVPASILQSAGKLPTAGPAWYVVLQAAAGVVQFAIGLAMLSGFRHSGVWGPFRVSLGGGRRA